MEYLAKAADISACCAYRYTLTRRWGDSSEPGKTVAWVGLNPSVADADLDDPTIRRVVGFTQAWGYTRAVMLNLFAFRATDPDVLKLIEHNTDVVGPRNDDVIRREAAAADLVVAAWGTRGVLLGRDRAVAKLLAEVGVAPHCLQVTKDGHPKHPLYCRGDLAPVPYTPKGPS